MLIVTEFGRTVAVNGTRGTDHGTAGCAFLAGGAVSGGRVLADWPGLAQRDLHEGRDLRATTDLRGVFKGVLATRFGIPEAALETSVFPDSAGVEPLELAAVAARPDRVRRSVALARVAAGRALHSSRSRRSAPEAAIRGTALRPGNRRSNRRL